MWTVGRYLGSACFRSLRAGFIPLCAAVLAARPFAAAAQVVSQPHVAAELVSDMDSVPAGGKWTMAVRLVLDPGWHIYWKNSGDAGSPTMVRWMVPSGFTVGPTLWPYPARFDLRPLAVYGYEGTVMLPVEVEAPTTVVPGQPVVVQAKVKWFVCEKICLAGSAELARQLPAGGAAGAPNAPLAEAFADARRRLPQVREEWRMSAARTTPGFTLRVHSPAGWQRPLDGLEFFADSNVVVDHAAPQRVTTAGATTTLELVRSSYATKPATRLRGVLVNRGGWDAEGAIRALVVDVPIADSVAKPAVIARANHSAPRSAGTTLSTATVAAAAAPKDTAPRPVVDTAASGAAQVTSRGLAPLAPEATPGLLLAFGFAFLGGLLLNLMPCVFPVISLKVLSFVALGGTKRAGAVRHGIAFAVGVIASFWALAAFLLSLRQAGAELGWGFQLQSAPFVAGTALLLFLLALSLLGVFEIGLPLTRVGGAAASAPSLASSFSTGVLATVVATPCTVPFMGPAIGMALTQPAAYALAVFTALGAGMALPYVALSAWPRLLDRLPRPGEWMVTFKQATAFPMFATVAWLVWVLGLQAGVNGVFRLLLAFTVAGAAVWLLGRWGRALHPARRRAAWGVAATLLIGAATLGLRQTPEARTGTPRVPAASATSDATDIAWEPFSPARVEALRRDGHPVFIDFTAAWCLSCKVNERVALENAGVRRRLRALGVATLRADWTSSDTTIARALAAFGREGVPLYLLYAPHRPDPVVLPTLLTPATVLEALTQVLPPQASM